jgi:ABC-type glycerol-3-phosphate transport system substrate-binding protein
VWDGGWVIPGYSQNATFNWDFLGIPGGNQAMVTDLLVVSAASENLEAAYDFARWMSFSSEGYAAEAALATAAGAVPTRMPVAATPENIDLYMSFVGERPGLRMALENLDNSQFQYADLAPQLEEFANGILDEARAALSK